MISLAERAAAIRQAHITTLLNNVELNKFNLSLPTKQTEIIAVDVEIKSRVEACNTQWNAETLADIKWFNNNKAQLPMEPFTLDETTLKFELYEPKKELKINNPDNFYNTLRADIATGIKGWNAITHVLPNRLKLLRSLVEGRMKKETRMSAKVTLRTLN